MLGHRDLKMEDYIGIASRRKWLLIVPPIVVCIAAFLVSLKIPNRYSSTTQVLVRGQSVPTNIVQPIVDNKLNERLASMKEQILSRSRLEPIVQQFNLFGDTKLSLEEKVQKLHDAIRVDAIEPMQDTQSAQLPGFRITVTLGSARLAQQVCAETTSLFVAEDKESRHATAGGITNFIDQNLEDARKKMNDQDAKLAAFKGRYLGSLPEDGPASLGMIGSLSTQLDAVTRGLEGDLQSKTFNESLLQQQLSQWKASQNTTTIESNPDTLLEQLKKAQDDLVKLRAQYTDEWPDVKAKVAEIEQLKKKIEIAQANKAAAPPADKQTDAGSKGPVVEPGAIVGLRAAINQLDISIKDKTRQQEELKKRIQTYEARLQLSPAVEQQYKELTRDQSTATEEYNNLLKEQGIAARSNELEQTQQGDKFSILDAANLPGSPDFPPRAAIAGGGFAGGLALGLGLIVLLEMRDKSIRTETDIAFFLKVPTLAMVPELDRKVTAGKRFVFATGKDEGAYEANT